MYKRTIGGYTGKQLYEANISFPSAQKHNDLLTRIDAGIEMASQRWMVESILSSGGLIAFNSSMVIYSCSEAASLKGSGDLKLLTILMPETEWINIPIMGMKRANNAIKSILNDLHDRTTGMAPYHQDDNTEFQLNLSQLVNASIISIKDYVA
jgi:hypothetical protein